MQLKESLTTVQDQAKSLEHALSNARRCACHTSNTENRLRHLENRARLLFEEVSDIIFRTNWR